MEKTTVLYAPRIASKDCTSWQWPHRVNSGKSTAEAVMDVSKRKRQTNI